MLNKFCHYLTHLFKTNSGKVVTWAEDGNIYVGFECSGCKIIAPETIVCCSINKESEIINE
jgi:hypothetical protein